MKKIINRLYNHQGGQLLISVILTALCFAVLYSTHDIHWAMVDDNETMKIISGYMTGEPVFCGPFINAFLGYFFTFLYGITTAISWYTIFHILIIFFSAVIVFWMIFTILSKKNISVIIPFILCLLVFFIGFTYMTLYLMFTYSAVAIGCAATSFLLIADCNSTKKTRYLYYVLSSVCMLLSFVLRYQCGQALACFWGLTLFYIVVKSFLKDRNKAVKKLIKVVCLALILVTSVTVIKTSNQKIKEDYETENYYLYNTYRSKYMDYTAASWYTNTEFYESIGWTKDFFHMTKAWYFMDERFNLETLQAINEETVSSGYGFTLKEKIFTVYDSVVNDKTGLAHTVAITSLIVANFLIFAFAKNKRKNIIHFIYAVCAVGGLFILSVYLCIQGRFLIHIYQTVALPSIVILFATTALLLNKDVIKDFTAVCKRKGLITVSSVLCVLLLSSAVLSMYDAYIIKQPKLKKITDYHADLNEYIAENPDNLYVYNQGDVSAFLTYEKETYTPNTILWGGCIYNSKNYYDFLDIHGYEHFYSENFYDDGVYFAAMPDFELDFFKNYLFETNGKTEFVEVYRTENVVIYDINKI